MYRSGVGVIWACDRATTLRRVVLPRLDEEVFEATGFLEEEAVFAAAVVFPVDAFFDAVEVVWAGLLVEDFVWVVLV